VKYISLRGARQRHPPHNKLDWHTRTHTLVVLTKMFHQLTISFPNHVSSLSMLFFSDIIFCITNNYTVSFENFAILILSRLHLNHEKSYLDILEIVCFVLVLSLLQFSFSFPSNSLSDFLLTISNTHILAETTRVTITFPPLASNYSPLQSFKI